MGGPGDMPPGDSGVRFRRNEASTAPHPPGRVSGSSFSQSIKEAHSHQQPWGEESSRQDTTTCDYVCLCLSLLVDGQATEQGPEHLLDPDPSPVPSSAQRPRRHWHVRSLTPRALLAAVLLPRDTRPSLPTQPSPSRLTRDTSGPDAPRQSPRPLLCAACRRVSVPKSVPCPGLWWSLFP